LAQGQNMTEGNATAGNVTDTGTGSISSLDGGFSVSPSEHLSILAGDRE
jgi:hypothetical protein